MDAETTTPRSAQPKRGPRLPPRWFIKTVWVLHRAAYRATGGRFGLRRASGDRAGMLRLKTVGRRTGEERVCILGYLEEGPDLITLAMNGWGQATPAWWLNLLAHPDATVDLRDGSLAISARVATEEERSNLWPRFGGGAWGDVDGYAARRSRETPIVIFERRS